MAIAWFIGDYRRHFPNTPFAITVELTHPQPGHASTYQEILQVPVRFGCTRNAMQVDPSWLDTPFDAENDYLFGSLRRPR